MKVIFPFVCGLCILLIYTIFLSILCVSEEGSSLVESNQQIYDFYKWVILKSKVFKSLDFQSRGHVFKTNGWLQGQISFSSFQGWSNEYQEFLGT